MHKSKLNIAILGCGRICRSHLKAILEERNRCNLIALCDNSLEKLDSTYDYAKKIFKEADIELNPLKYSNYKKLLNEHKEKKNKH